MDAESLTPENPFGCALLPRLPLGEAVPKAENAFFVGTLAVTCTASVLESNPDFGVEFPNDENFLPGGAFAVNVESLVSAGCELLSNVPLG